MDSVAINCQYCGATLLRAHKGFSMVATQELETLRAENARLKEERGKVWDRAIWAVKDHDCGDPDICDCLKDIITILRAERDKEVKG